MVKSRYAEGPHKWTCVHKKMTKGPSLYFHFDSYYSEYGGQPITLAFSLAHDSPLLPYNGYELIHIFRQFWWITLWITGENSPFFVDKFIKHMCKSLFRAKSGKCYPHIHIICPLASFDFTQIIRYTLNTRDHPTSTNITIQGSGLRPCVLLCLRYAIHLDERNPWETEQFYWGNRGGAASRDQVVFSNAFYSVRKVGWKGLDLTEKPSVYLSDQMFLYML